MKGRDLALAWFSLVFLPIIELEVVRPLSRVIMEQGGINILWGALLLVGTLLAIALYIYKLVMDTIEYFKG